MGLFDNLDVSCKGTPTIDWDLTPALTFTIFESWGTRMHIKSKDDLYYYFYIDNWNSPPKLYLMERGIKYAKVLARIEAPRHMIDNCISEQGKKSSQDKAYAIDDKLQQWLMDNIVDVNDGTKIIPMARQRAQGADLERLPSLGETSMDNIKRVHLPTGKLTITEAHAIESIKNYNFYEQKRNPAGKFQNYFVNNNDGLTVTDFATGIMWQAGGCDIGSITGLKRYVKNLNNIKFAGYDDWRIPSLEEALSLLEPEKNKKGLHIHECFSEKQPFIFVKGKQVPGGHWFVDFNDGWAFWASGHNPGGFGRVCRLAETGTSH